MGSVNPIALRMFDRGATTTDVVNAKLKTLNGDPCSPRTARRWRSYWKEQTAIPFDAEPDAGIETEVTEEERELVRRVAKNKFVTITELANRLNTSPNSVRNIIDVMRGEGFNILTENGKMSLSTKYSVLDKDEIPDYLADSHHLRIAVASDWHVGSKYEQHTRLMHFLKEALDRGYESIFVPGDFTDGLKMRQGHELGLYAHSTEALETLAREPLDYITSRGGRVYAIGGNHDASILKHCYTDLIWRLCKDYPDVYFLGYDRGDVPITDNAVIRLWHPAGSGGANPTGKMTKAVHQAAVEEMVDQLNQDEDEGRVVGIVAGHLHIYNVSQYGSRWGMWSPCFQSQTDYLKRIGLVPLIGGTLLDIYLDDTGWPVEWRSGLMQYRPIKDDYKQRESLVREVDSPEVWIKVHDS